MRTIIATVGTSVASGLSGLRNVMRASLPWGDDSEDARVLRKQLGEKLAALDLGDGATRIAASAELNSLHRLGAGRDDRVVLLASDTTDGRLCAEAVGRALVGGFGLATDEVQVTRVEKLVVGNAEVLRKEGLPNFLGTVLREVERARAEGRTVVLNPTGGFKGVVPFLTAVGFLHGLRTVYVFEHSQALIDLPPLPLTFDLRLFERALPALELVRHEGVVKPEAFFSRIQGLEESERELFASFLETDDDGWATLSPLMNAFCDQEQRGATRVLLSPDAQEVLAGASSRDRQRIDDLLARLSHPLWRAQHWHSFKGTDLAVFKPPHTPLRPACVLEPDAVKVCLLYLDHDLYERDLPRRRASQFGRSSFVEWVPPRPEAPLAGVQDAVEAELRARIEGLVGERAGQRAREAQLRKRHRQDVTAREGALARKNAALEDLRQRLRAAERGIGDAEERIAQLHDELERTRAAANLVGEPTR